MPALAFAVVLDSTECMAVSQLTGWLRLGADEADDDSASASSDDVAHKQLLTAAAQRMLTQLRPLSVVMELAGSGIGSGVVCTQYTMLPLVRQIAAGMLWAQEVGERAHAYVAFCGVVVCRGLALRDMELTSINLRPAQQLIADEHANICELARLIENLAVTRIISSNLLNASEVLAVELFCRGYGRVAAWVQEEVVCARILVRGEDHEDTVRGQVTLARIAASIGDNAEALLLMHLSVSQRERMSGPEHVSTMAMRAELALVAGYMGQCDGAIAVLRAELGRQEASLGPNEASVIDAHSNLAAELLDSGNAGG